MWCFYGATVVVNKPRGKANMRIEERRTNQEGHFIFSNDKHVMAMNEMKVNNGYVLREDYARFLSIIS